MGDYKKKNRINWIMISSTAVILAIAIINVCVLRNDAFWDASITSCTELLITLLVGYLYIEKKQDERMRKELIVITLDKVIKRIDNETFYTITNSIDVESILYTSKDIENQCRILYNNENMRCIKNQLQDIEKQIYEYRLFIENHKADISYLKKSKSDLRYKANQITNDVQIVRLKVYS